MKPQSIAAALLALGLLACGPQPGQKIDPSAGSGCPDDGPRLPETGVCAGRVHAYLTPAEGATDPTLPEGCSWSVNETKLPGDEALLYRAAACNGVKTKLAFAGGAHSASISYETSALGGDAAKGRELIRLFGVDPDPQGALKAAIAELPADERAVCGIEPAGIDGWPKDALVIRPNAAARATAQDGPLPACGPFGVDEDAATYWRIRQGYAWYFNLPQDQLDFDPASITVISQGGAKPE
jgi:hypothetical protein